MHRSEPLYFVKRLLWPWFNRSGHKPQRVSCNPMPSNSIQTGLIERAKVKLPQTETGIDCLKVLLTIDLKGEGFRCSSRRHLIPRSDRWVPCQCRWVRPERSGLRKLTAALLWPLIWMCCVKTRASSGLLTYSHNSRKGWYTLNFILLFISACFGVASESGWWCIKEEQKCKKYAWCLWHFLQLTHMVVFTACICEADIKRLSMT